jgi:hypothetical protein
MSDESQSGLYRKPQTSLLTFTITALDTVDLIIEVVVSEWIHAKDGQLSIYLFESGVSELQHIDDTNNGAIFKDRQVQIVTI